MTAPAPKGSYQRHKDRAGRAQREQSRDGRNIGPIPAVADPARKAAGARDFRVWIDTYFAQDLPWSADHLRVIARIQRAVLEGGQFAIAMPRGSGKTTLAELACLWAVAYGHRQFVVLIGATEADAVDRLDTTIGRIEAEGAFADDFPELAFPIQQLEGIAHRCAGQLTPGILPDGADPKDFEPRRSQITWTQAEIVLPTILDHRQSPPRPTACSSAIFKVAGIEGRIRGMKFQRPDGRSVRPDLVIIDDPQTDASARSLSQCATRERIVAGAVLGLAGPGKKIAALMPCTVIRAGDMADNLLDRQKNPEWNGERCKLLYRLPTNMGLWDRYGELRAESLRQHGDLRDATAFYEANRAAMEEGAEVAWPARYQRGAGEVSALQYAMNLRLQDEAAFAAEYQNEPLAGKGIEDAGIMSADAIAAKLHGIGEAIVPIGATKLTAFVDVQGKLLYWMVVAWDDATFTGYVIAYGAWPDQQREYFTLNDAQVTYELATGIAGVEGALYAALQQLVDEFLLGSEWVREDGTAMRIDRCMVDANWNTNIVDQFCRQSPRAAQLLASHGRFFGPAATPIGEREKKSGEMVGPGWKITGGAAGKTRRARYVVFETNDWKTFVHSRLAVPMAAPGCLSLWGQKPARHRMLAEHLTSESRERVQGSKRVVDVWDQRPNTENHWFDCLVGCAVGASTLGVTLRGLEGVAQPKPPVLISYRNRRPR